MGTDVVSPPLERGPEAGTVRLTINGDTHELELEPRVSLLDALREHLGLTGSKKGCDQGTCGACTVWVDGRRVLGCLTLAVTCEGREVTTIEGLDADGQLHPMQAGAAFTAMLQLSLVCERWPLAGLGRLRSGITALVLSWGAGIGAYFLFVNLDAVPAAERAAAGLRNPGGPIPAPDFGSALIAVGVWQALFFIALRGWPVNTISQRGRRLITGNVLVIGLGAATYLLLRDVAALQPGTISAACGCIISAAIIVGMLFEGWPAARLSPAPARALTLVITAAVAVALNSALAAYADGVPWTRATPDDWVTTAALSFAGAGIILHVGIGLRWPFATKTKENP